MHPNPLFRKESDARNLAFVRDRGFGTLAVTVDGAPLISHIPFRLSEDAKRIEAHLVRSNPIARAIGPGLPAVLAVTGPDGYISPDWYGVEDQVPTWNYVAVHLRGTLHAQPVEALRPHLDQLAEQFEARLAPKPVWQSAKMTPEVLDRMLRMIVPVEMDVADMQGTWKLSQNKPSDARSSAAGAVAGGIGQELDALALLMAGIKAEE